MFSRLSATRRMRVADFFEITKPRIMALAVFTALTGYVAASPSIEIARLLGSVLFIAVGAGGAGAFNMAFEHRTDALMRRTSARPTATGRITPAAAIVFAAAITAVGVLGLLLVANALAAALLAFAVFYYAILYTLILKRRTPQNIVIGGAAGALPPLIGWVAASGALSVEAWLLFLIIFLWTPPHSWALALYIRGDYARAGIPMLPVAKGVREARRQIWLYSLALFPISVAPAVTDMGGALYAAIATIGGVVFLCYAWRVFRSSAGTDCTESLLAQANDAAAKALFRYSIFWLFALFSAILVERLI